MIIVINSSSADWKCSKKIVKHYFKKDSIDSYQYYNSYIDIIATKVNIIIIITAAITVAMMGRLINIKLFESND